MDLIVICEFVENTVDKCCDDIERRALTRQLVDAQNGMMRLTEHRTP